MNPDGTGQVNISNNPALDWLPAWSADGMRSSFGATGTAIPSSTRWTPTAAIRPG